MTLYILLTLFWLVLLVFWFVSAFSAKRMVKGGIQGSLIVRVLLVVVLIVLWNTDTLHGLQGYFITSPVVKIIGLAVVFLGIALAIWARIYLGTNWGMPMTLKEEPELVTNGPYAYIRHPIYSGILLAMLGSAFVTGINWFVAFVIFAAYFIYIATREEQIMSRQFPVQYSEYKKKTKMLMPFIF